MIRYVYIGEQIDEGNEDFAFYDTITEKFLCFNYESVFNSRDDFWIAGHDLPNFDRCFSLIPDDYRRKSE